MKKWMIWAFVILISAGSFVACSKESVKDDFFEMHTETIENVKEVAWIDRIEISSELRAFYDTLVEGADNDGIADILIEDSYFAEDSLLEVLTISGQAASEEEMENELESIKEEYTQLIHATFEAFTYDHPEVFWIGKRDVVNRSVKSYTDTFEYSATFYFTLKDEEFDIRMDEYRSQVEIKYAINTFDAQIDQILAQAEGKSNYEKLVYFNEYLTTHNEYNTKLDYDSTPLSSRNSICAILGSSGDNGPVCEAYAKAFKVLCDKSGIPCISVIGSVYNHKINEVPTSHQWNYVGLDGAWYAVDVTWNDPISEEEAGAISGKEIDTWFLLGSDSLADDMKFSETHRSDNEWRDGYYFSEEPILSKKAYVP